MSSNIQFADELDDVAVATDALETPDDPSEIFETLVADPSRCCQQCYRRLNRQEEFDHATGREHGSILSFVWFDLPSSEPDWNTADREYFERVQLPNRSERVNPPGGRPGESRSACGFCGAVEPHRSPSTRSREEALGAAAGISATLQEFAVSHNPLALVVEVGDLKRDPDHAGDDFKTFRKATARAVEAGRGRPRRPR